MQPQSVGNICDTQAGASQDARTVRASQDPVAQTESIPFGSLRDVPLDQARKIQFELVPFTFGVWTLDFAQLALEAGIHYCRCFSGSDLSNIAIVIVIDE
jgi:hypothetical protein